MLKWLPVIDPDSCTGCVACVDACNPQSLDMVDTLPVLARAETCNSDEHCMEACPTDAIRMDWVESEGDTAVGRWQEAAAGS